MTTPTPAPAQTAEFIRADIKIGDRVRWEPIGNEGVVVCIDDYGVGTVRDDGTGELYPWSDSSGCPASELVVVASKPLTLAQRVYILAGELSVEADAEDGASEGATPYSVGCADGRQSAKRDAAVRILEIIKANAAVRS